MASSYEPTNLDKGKGPETEAQTQAERSAEHTVASEDANPTAQSSASTSSVVTPEPNEEQPPPLPPRRPEEPPRHRHDAAAAARRQERQQPVPQIPIEPARQPTTAKEMANQPYTHELRLLPPYNKTFSRFKLLLAFFLFAIGASVVTISAILLGAKPWSSGSELVWLAVLLWIGIPWGPINMAWNAAEILTHCARGSDSLYPRGIHPGAHVGMHLWFWMFSIVAVGMAATAIWEIQGAVVLCPDSYPGLGTSAASSVANMLCGFGNWFGAFADFYISYVYALLGLYCAAFILHLTLFIWACVDIHHRRRLRLGNMVASNNEQGAILMPGLDMILQSWQEQTYRTPMIEDKVLQIPNGHFQHNKSSTTAPLPPTQQTAGSGEARQ